MTVKLSYRTLLGCLLSTLALLTACAAPAVSPPQVPAPAGPGSSVSPAAPSGTTASGIVGDFGLRPSSTVAGINIAPVEIPLSDGKKLAADVYMPEKGGPFPAIVIQTPYNKALYNPVLAQELGGQRLSGLGAAAGGLSGSFMQSTNYAVVTVDVRGRFASRDASGTGAVSLFDGFDVVEWVAKQPWCNGKVGTWGSSALGNVQYATASRQPPHLACIMPRVSDYSNTYDKYYWGGVMRKEYLTGLTMASWGGLSDTVAAHPLNDGFYDGKDYADPATIKVPALLVGGWWDIHDMPRVFNDLVARGEPAAVKNFRVMICPSSHGNVARDGPEGELEFPNAGTYARDEQKKFFDYWLRGAEGKAAAAPPVTYYQMGSNEWRTASQWPPEGMKKASYYLGGDGALSLSPLSQGAAQKQFIFDPKDPVPSVGGNIFQPGLLRGPADQSKKVETHKDVLIFSSDVLAEDTAIDGEISATLYVSSDSEDTDVAIRVTDVYPDGKSMIVRDGIQRLSHMEGDKTEKFITPGTVYPVTVKTYSVGQTFLKGHRIRLIVSASNYPRYGTNNGSSDRKAAPKIITDTLYFDAAHPSVLVLPVMSK